MILTEIIQQKISREGPISFRDFMEMCLYYPGLGYYTSGRDRIGKEGDYYTSSSLTPAFGAMIGKQLEEMWRLMGKKPFTIVEYGAGTGKLCLDILSYIKNNPGFYGCCRYCIIEKSPVMRKREQELLPEKVSWHDDILEIPEIAGCILSNELIDNFSVHLVVMESELMEVFVNYENGFTELLRPAGEALKDYLKELEINLPRGYRTEINLEATKWISEIATSLKKGYVITIDYGFPSAGLYQDYRNRGTLICYNRHQISEDPYRDIGEQDITSHVNFSALYHWGCKHGLEGCGFTDQGHFLEALGFREYLKKLMEKEIRVNYKKEAFLTDRLLYDMGNQYKVFIQSKGSPGKAITGLAPV